MSEHLKPECLRNKICERFHPREVCAEVSLTNKRGEALPNFIVIISWKDSPVNRWAESIRFVRKCIMQLSIYLSGKINLFNTTLQATTETFKQGLDSRIDKKLVKFYGYFAFGLGCYVFLLVLSATLEIRHPKNVLRFLPWCSDFIPFR